MHKLLMTYTLNKNVERLIIIILTSLAVITAFIVLAKPAAADTAIGQRSPKPGSSITYNPHTDSYNPPNPGNPTQPWHAVGTHDFNGRVSWVKIYIPVNDNSTDINITEDCSVDVGQPDVEYAIHPLNGSENNHLGPGTGMQYEHVLNGARPNCGGNNTVSFNSIGGSGVPSTIVGHTQYKVFSLLACMTSFVDESVDNERSFQVTASDPSVRIGISKPYSDSLVPSYCPANSSPSDEGFAHGTAIYQRNAPPDQNIQYSVQIAPTCESQFDTTGTFPVVFFDSDASKGDPMTGQYPPQNLTLKIYEADRQSDPPDSAWHLATSYADNSTRTTTPRNPGNAQGLAVWNQQDNTYGPTQYYFPGSQKNYSNPGNSDVMGFHGGGSGLYDVFPFQADNQHIYKVEITGFNWHNTIQMVLPFDQLDASPTGNVGDKCQHFTLDGSSRVSNGIIDDTNDDTHYGISNSVVTVNSKQGDNNPDKVTFTNWIHNNGDTPATYNWKLQGCYSHNGPCTNQDNWSAGSGPCQGDNQGIVVAGGQNNPCPLKSNLNGENVPPGQNDTIRYQYYEFPQDAQDGDYYCMRMGFTNRGGVDDSSWTYTNADKDGHYNLNKGVCVQYQAASGPPQCGQSTLPNYVQVGDQFKFKVGVQYRKNSPPPADSGSDKFVVKLNGVNQSSSSGGTINGLNVNSANFTQPAIASADSYTLTWSVYASDGVTPIVTGCSDTVPIVLMPYFKIFGSGASAGGDYSGVTPDTGSAGYNGLLAGWNDNTGQDIGSSTELSNLALLTITGVASAQPLYPSTNKGAYLTFANDDNTYLTQDNFNPLMGGRAGHCNGTDTCLPDFAEKGPITNLANATISLSGKNGSYTASNGVNILGSTITGRVTLFVNGNVNILGDLKFGSVGGAGTNPLNWTSAQQIPSLMIYSNKGNIYIAPSVQQLDGIYVAKKGNLNSEPSNSNGGIIFTCGSNNAPHGLSNYFDDCGNQLVIHGSFVAEQVNLMRTFGTLNNAIPGENRTNGPQHCSASSAPGSGQNVYGWTCAAEVFDFSPEMYLAPPPLPSGCGTSYCYQSIISLPPVL